MRVIRRLLVLALLGAAGWALVNWPLINDVETGRTPEYPDLQPRVFSASPEKVGRAVEEAIKRLPGWTLVGVGHGPAGTAIQAVHETRLLRFKDDVTVRISREGGKTRVSIRSRSRVGKIDFGQNARNIRELFVELDRRL
jgi:uncharacterized protein (DUF1499 family)